MKIQSPVSGKSVKYHYFTLNAMSRLRQHSGTLLASLVLFNISILIHIQVTHGLLFFPSSTTLQITSSISMPLDLPTRTKVFADMGFQMNYNLPYDPSSFYNASIWADELARRRKRNLNYGLEEVNELLNEGIHPQDFTAGEMYAGLERLLPDYGFHRSCLLRSVCELALHPFEESHRFNLITQVIVFLLTPSQHEGFSDKEKLYRDRYERAEQIGFLGGDCQRSYPKCDLDILSIVTKLVR